MNAVIISDVGNLGSGYKTLILPLAQGIAEHGHVVKVLGLGYRGDQHDYDLSLIPVANYQEADATLRNVVATWQVDVLIIALDIPVQLQFLKRFRQNWKDIPFKYVGIFPVEADPVCFNWAMSLMEMDKRFVISQFGADECMKVGVDAEHIRLGIDLEAWRQPEEDERKDLREKFGFTDDTFVILTVADNQERKHLSRSLEIVADFIKKNPEADIKYLMVTREHLNVGWILRDYAQVLEINPNLLIFERGLPFDKLWNMYAVADCFLLTSKAEGLGLPLLEAMGVGVHCIGTDCTAIAELLGEGRGTLIEPLDDFDLRYIDPFGNANRYFAKRSHGLEQLQKVYDERPDTTKAREYVESRTWDIPIAQLNKALEELEE